MPLLHFQLGVHLRELTRLGGQFALLLLELAVLQLEACREIRDLTEPEHAVQAGGQDAPDVADRTNGGRVVSADAGQRDDRCNLPLGQHGNSQDLARPKLATDGGEGKVRVGRDVGDVLDLARGQGRAQFALQVRGRESRATAGAQADRVEVLKGGLGIVQEVDRTDLRAGMRQQGFEQLAAERVNLLLAEHDVGELGDVPVDLCLGLNRLGHGVERGRQVPELVGGDIAAASVLMALAEPHRRGRQLRQRLPDPPR